MSVNPVSQPPAAAIASLNQNLIQNPSQKDAQQKPAATPITPVDTVLLSSQAKAAAGNAANDSNGQ